MFIVCIYHYLFFSSPIHSYSVFLCIQFDMQFVSSEIYLFRVEKTNLTKKDKLYGKMIIYWHFIVLVTAIFIHVTYLVSVIRASLGTVKNCIRIQKGKRVSCKHRIGQAVIDNMVHSCHNASLLPACFLSVVGTDIIIQSKHILFLSPGMASEHLSILWSSRYFISTEAGRWVCPSVISACSLSSIQVSTFAMMAPLTKGRKYCDLRHSLQVLYLTLLSSIWWAVGSTSYHHEAPNTSPLYLPKEWEGPSFPTGYNWRWGSYHVLTGK